MPDEHESASAEWLDHPSTQREIAVVKARYPNWTEFEVIMFVLQMEVLVDLNVYGSKIDDEADPDRLLEMVDPDEEDDEPWKRSNK
jgi:hypothetical protein